MVFNKAAGDMVNVVSGLLARVVRKEEPWVLH